MFIRRKERKSESKYCHSTYVTFQIVENYRKDGKVKQRTKTLGTIKHEDFLSPEYWYIIRPEQVGKIWETFFKFAENLDSETANKLREKLLFEVPLPEEEDFLRIWSDFDYKWQEKKKKRVIRRINDKAPKIKDIKELESSFQELYEACGKLDNWDCKIFRKAIKAEFANFCSRKNQ